MTLICFASQKGSPGTTAVALAVAAALRPGPGRRKLLLEADSAGGALAIRYGLPVEPGLLTLAAAVRGGLESEGLWRHSQELPGGLPVVLCPDGPEQVGAAMSASGDRLGRFLNGLGDVDVICDMGRLGSDPSTLAFVAEARALLMVARPTAEQLQPAARRLAMVRPTLGNLGWVLVGQKPYGAAEVERTYRFPVVGVIADDRRSVVALEQGAITKRLRRHPFIRSSVTLAKTLSTWLEPVAVVPSADVRSEVTGESRAVTARPTGGPPAPTDVDGRCDDAVGPELPVGPRVMGTPSPRSSDPRGADHEVGVADSQAGRSGAGPANDAVQSLGPAVRPPPAFRARTADADGSRPPTAGDGAPSTPAKSARRTATSATAEGRPIGAGLPGPRLPAWPPVPSPAPPAPPVPPGTAADRPNTDPGLDDHLGPDTDRGADTGDHTDAECGVAGAAASDAMPHRDDDDPSSASARRGSDVDWAMP